MIVISAASLESRSCFETLQKSRTDPSLAAFTYTQRSAIAESHNKQRRSNITMESMSPLSKEETSLLTLSRNDLSSNKNNNSKDTLVLMQMPSSLSAKDMKGAHIVASSTQQACLILEEKATTYSISRVETSNAYVLVPPTSTPNEQRPRKKVKTDTTLVSVPVRLLQAGGSGASFLELKKRNLNLADLQEQLQDYVFDPFDETKQWTGRTLDSLAVDLQCSQQEVVDGLKRMQALGIMISKDDTMQYGLLSEEALQEAKSSIVATLTECDEFQDYAGTGISETQCVKEVMIRVPSGEQYEHMAQVIQHTLRTLQSDSEESGDGDKIQLDVKKVRLALFVEERLYYCSFAIFTLTLPFIFRLQSAWSIACFPNSRIRGRNKNSLLTGNVKCPVWEKSIKCRSKCCLALPCFATQTIHGSIFQKKSFLPTLRNALRYSLKSEKSGP